MTTTPTPNGAPGAPPAPTGEADDRLEAPAGELRPWRVGAAVAAIVVLVAVAAIAVVNRPDDRDTGSVATMMGTAMTPIAGMRAGCEQWASARGAAGVPGTMAGGMGPGGLRGAAPDAAWCASMTAWMTDEVDHGRGGPMMWQTAEGMATTCRQWVAGEATGGATGGSMPRGTRPDSAWCDEMVTWMRGRTGGWNGWMNGGPMNGGPMNGGTRPT